MTIAPAENIPGLWIGTFPFPKAEQHKYMRGQVAVNGGDMAHSGAARLAARAALRVGAGLVSIICSQASLPIYATTNLAVMCKVADDNDAYSELIADSRMNALIVGPGNGISEETKNRALSALETQKPLVIDADGLTSFAGSRDVLFSALHARCVLTPHEGEFAKLFEMGTHIDRTWRAHEAAKISGAVIVLKGERTLIAAPDGRLVININAPPTLATAGSGDVLAGMIGGLMAASMPAFEAACAGVWLHGAAAQAFGCGLIAEDLPEMLPRVMSSLRNSL